MAVSTPIETPAHLRIFWSEVPSLIGARTIEGANVAQIRTEAKAITISWSLLIADFISN